MVKITNFLLYQVGWFACVLGAAWQFPWLGSGIALSLIAIHFLLTTDRRGQVSLALAAVAVGAVVDSTLIRLGAVSFSQGVMVDWLPPLWMCVLWAQFSTTFHYSMRWLSGRYRLSACFGFLGAPLAFFAGERLGAITFLAPRMINYLVLAVFWSAAVPLLVAISDRLRSHNPDYHWLGRCERNHQTDNQDQNGR